MEYLKSKRIIIRPTIKADNQLFIDFLFEPYFNAFASIDEINPRSFDSFVTATSISQGNHYFLTSVLLKSQEPKGFIYVSQQEEYILLGYFFNKDSQGHGYFKESMKSLISHFYEENPHRQIIILCYSKKIEDRDFFLSLGFRNNSPMIDNSPFLFLTLFGLTEKDGY
ncbi:MAG: GNAT family N-acetyltransferase [Bacilli bacterium]